MSQKIIFIVDDDPLMHVLYKGHLERAGYNLVTAKDGEEVQELAIREKPGLIFMDIMMARMDGISALRVLKSNEETKSIPVIIISGNAVTYDAARREAMNAGAAGFLSKPFSPASLFAEVQKTLPGS